MNKAIFAAGCFWGVEHQFGKIPGVIATSVGYTGGSWKKPSYEEVCTGRTGHAEAVEIEYDPLKVSYEDLLRVFWQLHDPTTLNRQGPDVGDQYRSAIFYLNEKQYAAAIKSKQELELSGKYKNKIVTEIKPASPFYKAEEYHQRYIEKNERRGCSF